MSPAVLLISTLDTKARETMYLRRRIEDAGVNVLLMDLSMGASSTPSCEIVSEEVARSAGWNIRDIRRSKDRSVITTAMIQGATKIAVERFLKGEVDGVLGLGGSTGSLMACDVMRALPFGLPKVMISSTAALPGLASRYIDTSDLMLFHSVVEIAGLSPLLKNVLDRAAAAVCGMVRIPAVTPGQMHDQKQRLVAMSMFGPCERCARELRLRLEKAGYSVIGFSAAGVCDRAMEDMIGQGYFVGAVDLAPGGVGEELLGGMRAAGPHRLETAGRMGLPQVIAPGGVNLMSPIKSRYKPDYHERRKYDLDKLRTFLRLSPEELIQVARAFADKVNRSQGPIKFLIPTRGWASFDRAGGAVHDPKEDGFFSEELKKRLKPRVEVIEVDANIEDDAFVEALYRAFLSFFPTGDA